MEVASTHDFQDHADALGRERKRRGAHEQRLHNVFFQNICDGSPPHIYSRTSITASVSVPEFGDSHKRIEPGVLC